jgi:2-C-methyl-D-erythritol 4-phosphate cytidylyltransferase
MNYVIVVAGGKGLRMGGEIPKQFQCLHGKPILMRTLETFQKALPTATLILVLPKDQQAFWQELCKEYDFKVPYLQADGGETRFHSVKNGLAKIPFGAEGVVAVHDGVRPFVSADVIRNCMSQAGEAKAVIPVVDVVETLRHLTPTGSVTEPRGEYRLVQTPQAFDLKILQEAYNQSYVSSFTDDASVVEAMGVPITLVEGNRENIKITTPFDKIIGEFLALKQDNV